MPVAGRNPLEEAAPHPEQTKKRKSSSLPARMGHRQQRAREERSADNLQNPVKAGFFLFLTDNADQQMLFVDRVKAQFGQQAEGFDLAGGGDVRADAGTGQNAISQTKQFDQTVALTGLALTKLDGTAKGGVIFALAKQFNIPIRFIGVGEGIDDLRDFESEPFVQALFAERERP